MTARQPFLHRHLPLVAGVTQAWSPDDGQIRGEGGISGIYHSDVRTLSRVLVTVGGEEPELIGSFVESAGRGIFVYAARAVDTESADPLVTVRRVREVSAGRVDERFEVRSESTLPVQGEVRLELASDLAGMDAVKSGSTAAPKPVYGAGWADENVEVRIGADPSGTVTTDGYTVVIEWAFSLEPGGTDTLAWHCAASDSLAVVAAPADETPEWPPLEVFGADPRLRRFVVTGLSDLAALRAMVAAARDDTVIAGGIPWFQTLFGRDAIWSAELILPLTWRLAASTLRALAALQGTKVDAATAEQPGKILHEIRRAPQDDDEQRTALPPVYYGTIDATLLWIGLLHDAFRAGMPRAEVEELLPNLECALSWIVTYGDADGDGLIEYFNETGTGLSNQGWKDSGDSVQFQDGTLATGAIALVEVQAYAYRALRVGADLLAGFGRPGADGYRARAARLRERFHASYWVADDRGPYLAMALDGKKRPVDAVASNMGHVIGTGILDEDQIAGVVDRLMGDDLFSGFGIRTLSSTAGRFWPLRYHGGTVWPHDNALIAKNLAEAGYVVEARRIAGGMLDAAEDFDYRLPELFAGYDRGEVPRAMPYPAACPVICWGAACVVTIAAILARDGA